MLSFKKVYSDELLQLALILSLLRCQSDSFYDHDLINLPIDHFDFENGTSWRSLSSNALRAHYVHPKNFDAVLLNYEREMFADINALGRYNRISAGTIHRPNITTYLLNVERTSSPITVGIPLEPLSVDILVQQAQEPPPRLEVVDNVQRLADLEENPVFLREENIENVFNSGIELTQEDMDLIEVLWKQDVDLGFSLDIQQQQSLKSSTATLASSPSTPSPSKGCEDAIVGGSKSPDSCSTSSNCGSPKKRFEDEENEDNIEKLKALREINDDNIKIEPGPRDLDPWAGLDYTIDTETGEYVIKGELDASDGSNCDALNDLTLPLPEFLLEDALQLVGIDDDISQEVSKECENSLDDNPASAASNSSGIDNDTPPETVTSFISEDKLVKEGEDQQPQPGSIASALLDAANAGIDQHRADQTTVDLDEDDDDLRLFDTMIQTSQFHHPHHSRAFQSRMPFVRAVSIEQHWQDLANLLSMPPGHHPSTHPSQQLQHQHAGSSGGANATSDSFNHHHHQYGGNSGYHLQAPPPPPPPPMHHHHHHHHHMGMAAMGGNMASMGASYCGAGSAGDNTRNVLLQNVTLNPPIGELNATGSSMAPYGNIGGTNLGNAVATSMNLTNSSEPMGDSGPGPHYKLEPSHDLLYYQNTTSELNQTDGLLSSILNDEDLQLMDMAMNEGMYTMRMLDNATTSAASVLHPTQLSMSNGGGGTASSTASSTAASSASSVSGAVAQTTRGTDMDRLDTSSDSAVSSMGSERVPSLSDGEWGDAGSDSGHTAGDHYVTDYHRKFGPYDYSYSGRQHTGMNGTESRIPPVAQKKHQMYGKRYFQDQGNTTLPTATPASAPTPPIPIKYEYRDPCIGTTSSTYHPHHMDGAAAAAKALDMKYYGHGVAAAAAAAAAQAHHAGNVSNAGLNLNHHHGLLGLDHVQHNHTYHLPVGSGTGAMQRPVSRDKGGSAMEKAARMKKLEDEHLTRDEKRARSLSVPISVDDIINLPMDEFNERLSKYDLSENQLSLIRDIRRRGKNKVAAQNCRKRKLDQILTLADEVKEMRDRKIRLVNDHTFVSSESIRIKEKYQQLYRHVFQNLRDPDGNHYSPYHYSLQTSADGSILVVPLSNSNNNIPERKDQQAPQKD